MCPPLTRRLIEFGQIDELDGLYLVQIIMQTPLGDVNQDGEFISDDVILVLSEDEYEDAISNNSSWIEVDWNFDGDLGPQVPGPVGRPVHRCHAP